ncbi:MAG: hypothetical protein KGZ84_02885 [Erysipelotrichia bacterium]|jgi:hypothetical protein|nr:hypothetical protein [Erysipelotrichia bacterium]
MGKLFKIFGVLIWISSIVFILTIRSVQNVDYIILAIVALSGIVTGVGFIGVGEIIRLLERQYHQNKALYDLFKQVGGAE